VESDVVSKVECPYPQLHEITWHTVGLEHGDATMAYFARLKPRQQPYPVHCGSSPGEVVTSVSEISQDCSK
jgi:hypothetical protein